MQRILIPEYSKREGNEATAVASLRTSSEIVIRRRYKTCPIKAPFLWHAQVRTLGDYFSIIAHTLKHSSVFWFRGHSRSTFSLTPSALRCPTLEKRNTALGLVDEMKRYLEIKLPRPPAATEKLAWAQVAQHYGLPTRLLDWTQNAAVALFFACNKDFDHDGIVAFINPLELNYSIDSKFPRIFNEQRDKDLINKYLNLDGTVKSRGLRTIAINPVWNTERISLQQGVFTLHGSRHFGLDSSQCRSLICLPILKEEKESLLSELHRVGIGEMSIFPEPEHVCAHLTRMANIGS